MYENKRILCVIPARGGSKGLPGKNIRMLQGKPLIAHSIEHAKRSGLIDRTIVSTDDKNIAQIAKQYGAEVPFLRPESLAGDKSTTIDVLLHAIDWCEKEGDAFDVMVLLHVTSPLRTVEDIDNCIKLLFLKDTENVFSVNESYRNPYLNMVEEVGSTSKVRLVKESGGNTLRQLAPKVYDINGAVYVWWIDVLKEQRKIFMKDSRIYVMPRERSVDIDNPIDFKIAEMLMNNE